MPDPRFFEDLGPATLGELAKLAGADLLQPDRAGLTITAVAPLDRAGPDQLTFFSDRRYLDGFKATTAGACFVTAERAEAAPTRCAVLICGEPHAAYAKASDRLHRARLLSSADPAIHPSAIIEDGVILGQGVVIGAGVHVGRGTAIGANAVIGPGVAIGRDCRIGANTTIGFSLIGDRVRVYANAVLGEAGFGVTASSGAALDVPQLGRVIVQDGVTIGSCTCIDRGAWDDTVVGENTKIDNLVQIAHNVQLGRNCLLAAQTGISGSVIVGDGAAFGGRAGVADHLNIGSRARVAAAAGVMHDIPAGEMWAGTPARPIRRFMREVAWLSKAAVGREETSES